MTSFYKLGAYFLFAFLFLSTTSSVPHSVLSPTLHKEVKSFTVVIDAGHGGKDPGCLGRKSKEKDVALAVALKLGDYIKEYMKDVRVVYTRDDDTFVELDERTAIANRNKADLFISIHCNAAKNRAVYGSETFTIGMHKTQENLDVAMRENSVILKEEEHKKKYNFDPFNIISYIKMSNFQSANQTKSIDFATKVQYQFENRVKRANRGVKQSGFLVLWKTAMPAALIEIGFLSNAKEEAYLNTENGQSYIASGIYRAFKAYKQEITTK